MFVSGKDLRRMHDLSVSGVHTQPANTRSSMRVTKADRTVRAQKMQEWDGHKTKARAMKGVTGEDELRELEKKIERNYKTSDHAKGLASIEARAHAVADWKGHAALNQMRREEEKREKEEYDRAVIEDSIMYQMECAARAQADAVRRKQNQAGLREQVAERAQRKLEALEREEQEAAIIRKQAEAAVKELEAKDARRKAAKREMAKNLAEENRRMREWREAEAAAEMELDRSLMIYQVQKAEYERQVEAQKVREKEDRDKRWADEVQRQIAKSGPSQHEIMEKRNRQYMEQKALADRERGRREAAMRESNRMANTRFNQDLVLQRQAVREAEAMEEEFHASIVREDGIMAAAESAAREGVRVARNYDHGRAVRAQRDSDRAKRADAALEPYREREEINKFAKAKARVQERATKAKLAHMTRQGYTSRVEGRMRAEVDHFERTGRKKDL